MWNACLKLFCRISLLQAIGLTMALTQLVKFVCCSSTQSLMLGPLMKCNAVITCFKRLYMLVCSSLSMLYNSDYYMKVSASVLPPVNVSAGVPLLLLLLLLVCHAIEKSGDNFVEGFVLSIKVIPIYGVQVQLLVQQGLSMLDMVVCGGSLVLCLGYLRHVGTI